MFFGGRKMKRWVIVNQRRFFTFIFLVSVFMGLLSFVLFQTIRPQTVYGAGEQRIASEKSLQTRIIYVSEGESLWSIAQPLAREYHKDPRDLILQIVELNNLEAMTLHPGQPLQLPII